MTRSPNGRCDTGSGPVVLNALPVRLGAAGIEDVMVPSLSVVEKVALDNAMQL